MEGYSTGKLDAAADARQPANFKLVTSEISKKACPGFPDTNDKYERLMILVEEALGRRSDFSRVSSECEASDLLRRQPTASIHVADATREASDEELLLGGMHTEYYLREMKHRTASLEESDEELLLDGENAENDPSDLIEATKEEYVTQDGQEKTIFVCSKVSAGWSQDTEAAARTGAASLIDTAADVYAGRYANAFVLARPPSHHAVGNADLARNGSKKNLPFGFCHLNSIGSAVANLRASHPELRVCIFDIDVHAGNGNEDSFWDDPQVFTVSIHEFAIWPGDKTCAADYVGGPHAIGSVLNFPIPMGAGDSEYYHVVKDYIIPRIVEFAPGIIFVAAGYDALQGDAYADQELTPDWYGWCISELVRQTRTPLVLNLEGGYTPENVVLAIGRSIDALAGAQPEDFLSCMSITPLAEETIRFIEWQKSEREDSLKLALAHEVRTRPSEADTKPLLKNEAHMEEAARFKDAEDLRKTALQAEADALMGKVNIKARTKKMKEVAKIAKQPKYIDACLVVKGEPPRFGNFVP
eukprot:TRINITY_DN87152_c0_g1_i1.p1 TRINITY_DN87152_c0_g1~~TRINITY_DN87152_c0_g1_i1.p1  ORF type:complete len:530 (+),score=85.91 TRINITY_DN87152_c0_g1_i1:74-1663(+)